MTGYSHNMKNPEMSRTVDPYYALCEDVELVRQPYGATIWKHSIGDFAITNHTGRIILEACAKQATIDVIVDDVWSEVGGGLDELNLKSDIDEFLASAEKNGHVSQHFRPSGPTGAVSGSLDRLSLVRADLSITWRCNLRCSYCYAGIERPSAELVTREWEEALSKLRASGAKKFIITGGEPFARGDILRLLQTADELGISVTLLTNGTLIDKESARQLAKLKGLKEIKVSLDSVTSNETHDCFRGVGSWDAAIQGLRLLQAQDISVIVNMTIHPLNYGEVFSAAAACAKNGWLLEASPIVREGLATEDHLLTSLSLENYQQEYRRAIEAFPHTLRVDELEITPEWDPSFRCAMLFGTVGVSPDGRLKPCLRSESFFISLHPMFDQTPSILDLDTVDVESLEFFRAIKQVRSSFVPQPSECGNCQYLHGTCNGCVVAKWFMEDEGRCPRKEVRKSEDRR